MPKFEIYRRVLPSLGPIIFRNFFLLVNGVIFVVVILLYAFGSTQAALFLGIVFLLNTLITTAQDIHARVLLERLQMLTALMVTRINKDPRQDGAGNTETKIYAEKILKGDLIKLKLGDQTPCEGKLISVNNLEISEALVTGESDSFGKKEGDEIIAGAIVTSGNGVMEAEGLFRESRMAKIAGEAKKYAASPSSIQTATNTVIKYSSYILIVVLLFVILRGILTHAPRLQIVTNAGALASTIVPQGLVVAITLLFAIGAASYSRRSVLFQEINATEKLGRIKNLCIDKTGTLTDNILVVEDMHIVEGFSKDRAFLLTKMCVYGLSDTSETILAVKKYLDNNSNPNIENLKVERGLSFSSWRRYGAVEVKESNTLQSVFVGAPDIFSPRVSNVAEKKWLENISDENAKLGKRVLCIASSNGVGLPKDLNGTHLSVVAVFVFSNTLREGIVEAIKFFQDRGIKIRVLSGDNYETVKAVAKSVGIAGSESVVTGEDMKDWSEKDFNTKAHDYTIFAPVLPEHKVKLVEAFRKDGFTAMVGDGVNDALAMKKADLGVAMFDGAPVTRQLADVILMTNSFTSLPGAVELADHFIRSIEISSGIYVNMSLVGLLFFIIISFFGYSYPLTPLNITFINYFTVGFATLLISYWALRPTHKIPRTDEKPFLNRVMPLVFYSAIVEAIGIVLVYLWNIKSTSSNILILLSFILFGFAFLILASKVYSGILTKKEKYQLFLFGILQFSLLCSVLQIPFILHFFNITLP
ncbi:HAD-IC family P-type ATPase [Candidatus Nomurabacteria bacterium]|nr:HAD-IC family P-type ATPase [Candidatus Nomurabacteria bacterium]